ncbi:MAG: hypothetical protein WC677_02735 [Clostridia bacterium]
MRVFESYSFNLKDKVKFKDTKEYIDQLLFNNNIKYDHIGFGFSYGDFDKLLSKYPSLGKYLKHSINPFNDELSSVPLKWGDKLNLHVEKEDEKFINEICKRIPRPYNFGFITILLDHVHWFQNISILPACNVDVRPSGFSFDSYNSNSICLQKQFDYGNKYNVVTAKIERTKSFDELTDISDFVKKFLDSLGKPTGQHLFCCLENDEKQAKIYADHEFNEIREQSNRKDIFKEFGIPHPETIEGIHNRVLEELQLPKGISPKKAMVQQGKEYGYQYKKFFAGQYIMQKTNVNNHIFQIEFSTIPLTCKFEASVLIKGYNFTHYFTCNQTMIKQQSDAEIFIKKVFEYAHIIEEEYSDMLLELYGKTPKWFDK